MGKDLKGKELGNGYSQRPNGLYQKKFYFENKVKFAYGHTKKECEQAYNKMLNELEQGFTSQKVVYDVYFAEWLKYIETMGRVKGSTLAMYKSLNDRHISPEFGKMRCDKITPKMVQKFQLELSEKYSPRTVNSITDLMHLVCERMVKDETIMRNPVMVDHISLKKSTERTNNRALSNEEAALFIEYSKESFYHNAVRMLFATGMRSGELRGLKWSDYDEKKGVLHIRRTASVDSESKLTMNTPKSNSGLRDLPLNDEIRKIIADQKKQQLLMSGNIFQIDGYMFTSTTGKVISRNVLKSAFNHISDNVKKAGFDFDRISPHACRHTFITVNLFNGENPYAVKAYVGHAMNAAVTESTYLGIDADKISEMISHNNMMDSKAM